MHFFGHQVLILFWTHLPCFFSILSVCMPGLFCSAAFWLVRIAYCGRLGRVQKKNRAIKRFRNRAISNRDFISISINRTALPGMHAYLLFFNNKKNKSYTFGNCQVPFTPKVKFISLRLKKMPLHLTSNLSRHRDRRGKYASMWKRLSNSKFWPNETAFPLNFGKPPESKNHLKAYWKQSPQTLFITIITKGAGYV